MKIALIWPKGFDHNYVMPLSLGYLKSNIDKSKHEVRILDCSIKAISVDSIELKNFLSEFNPDIIGVSCWSVTYYEALAILKFAKKLNKKIITVIGGAHVTTYPDRVIKEKFVDFVFRGESELSFNRFLDILKNSIPDFNHISGLVYKKGNKIVKNEIVMENDLDKIIRPDYDSILLDEYINKGYKFNTTKKFNAPVWITRGCPYRCAFCSASLQNGKVIRKHSILYMIDWIKYLYNVKSIRHISIIDDNFTFDINYAKEFCKAMIDLEFKGLTFGTPNGIRVERVDEELLLLMKQAGWENIIIAPESGSKDTLKRMRKDLNLDIIPDRVKMIRNAGFKVHGFFIIGYPGDTLDDIKKTISLLRKCRFNFFFLNNFQPLPGTPVYDELVKKKEIKQGLLPKNYSSGERVYTPKGLKGFNFPAMVLQEYIYLAVSNPLNIPYMFKLINPFIIVKKIFSNLINMVHFK